MVLEINFKDTIKKAKQLQTLSHDITGICGSSVEEIQSATYAAWTGDGGDRFRKDLRKHSVSLANKAKSLNSVAVQLERTARTYERIEQAALSIFKK